jgi:Domain of Unknown Function (DUF1080)
MFRLRLIGALIGALTGLNGADNALTSQEQKEGWILLFDGKSLHGWDSANMQANAVAGQARSSPGQGKAATAASGAPSVGSNPRSCSTPMGLASVRAGASHWEVVDGALTPCGEPAGYLTTKENYKDFILDIDFRTGEDTNSGVFFRSPEGNAGYEVQIWKAQPQGYNTGSIVGTAKTDTEHKFVPGQWNHYEITADGDHLVVVLNGIKTLDVHDSKFSDGRIRLQYQKFPIEFKNVKIRLISH